MPSAADVLQDLLQTLRGTGLFALVSLGDAGTASVVPRASVWYDGQEVFPSDDDVANRWVRLRARVTVHTRSENASEAILRAADLSEAAGEAILSDPYRGKRCLDLPIGRATEVGRSEMSFASKRPEAEMSFTVRCHFEAAE
jgi:hypothetical protein